MPNLNQYRSTLYNVIISKKESMPEHLQGLAALFDFSLIKVVECSILSYSQLPINERARGSYALLD
jgi:hypothetical protein